MSRARISQEHQNPADEIWSDLNTLGVVFQTPNSPGGQRTGENTIARVLKSIGKALLLNSCVSGFNTFEIFAVVPGHEEATYSKSDAKGEIKADLGSAKLIGKTLDQVVAISLGEAQNVW